jgi:hypothetical protein
MMPNVKKHTDLLILSGVVAMALLAVLLIDHRGPLARDQRVGGIHLEGETALYQGRGESGGSEVGGVGLPSSASPDWIETEDGNPRQRNRHVPPASQPGVVQLGEGAPLGGRRPFPDDNPWNQPVDQLPVDPLSDILIERIGGERHVHPDFGAGFWNGAQIGIPYVVVSKEQPPAPVKYTAYGDESDPGPFPIPHDAPIEGDPNIEGDRHVVVIDRDNWKLYELFRAFPIADGQLWRAECGAVFNLATNVLRPEGWTSADAAGLPIFPGLVRYEEAVELKEIQHALRFTVSHTRRAYVPPARHWASRSNDPTLPPMGMRVRLKNSFDLSSYPPEVQVILVALKKYGMILADNGSDWFLSGAPDPRWSDENLHTVKQIKGSDFEVVLMEGLVEE